jgi:hypothetical protein
VPSWPSARIRRGMQHAGPHSRNWDAYGAAVRLDPWFVTGLAEGEGCSASLSPSVRYFASGSRPGRSSRSRWTRGIATCRGATGLLRMRLDPGIAMRSGFKYEARSVGDLVDRIVPHFETYPLRGAKSRSFSGFATACQMIGQGDHLRSEGMAEIVRIAYEMNLGKRRHPASTLLRALK